MTARWRCVVALTELLHALPTAADPPSQWLDGLCGAPQRPFLIVDSPRRFPPGASAMVRLHTMLVGPVQVAMYRVRDPRHTVAAQFDAAGVQTASTPLGAESEALLLRPGDLPRRGALLDLLSHATLPPAALVADDSVGPVDVCWGATDGRWTSRDVPLGALPTGLYLVRAMAGGWAASSLVSVGALTVLARRGDHADRIVVTDGEGVPQAGVAVWRTAAGERVTDARGEATFPAAEAYEVRFGAARGQDVAWADVTHLRASACDVRVEMVTGRLACLFGEPIDVRGYVRGCDAGVDGPLAREPVGFQTDGGFASIVTGSDGGFVAGLRCGDELTVRVRGVEHRRTVPTVGGGVIATRPADLGFDRPWAAPGETVTATVADRSGGWPTEAQASYRVGDTRGSTTIGPGRPAVFTFVMPPTTAPLTRVPVHVEVRSLTATTVTTNELWTGTQRALFERPSDWSEAPAPRGATPAAYGDFDVTPERAFVTPGEVLGVGLRAPPLGATLVTLERGDVWASRVVAAGTARTELPVARGARGLATVVATHVHDGEVRSVRAALEVETSRRFGLRVTTDALDYPAGTGSRVTLLARSADGRAHDATVTLWVADAAWWDFGEDDHPPADRRMLGTERPASAGDSAHPPGDGGDEGRRFATVLEWNGRALPGATFRHAWASAGPTLRLDARGTFAELATRIAGAGGLRGATVCATAAEAVGRAHLRVQNVPWDVAAVRVGVATRTLAEVVDGALNFRCTDGEETIGMGNIGTMGHGSGSGSGQGYGSGGERRYYSIDGTVVFVAAVHLGPSGTTTVNVPLPAHPGRWRYEAFALGPDGGTASAHTIATTH